MLLYRLCGFKIMHVFSDYGYSVQSVPRLRGHAPQLPFRAPQFVGLCENVMRLLQYSSYASRTVTGTYSFWRTIGVEEKNLTACIHGASFARRGRWCDVTGRFLFLSNEHEGTGQMMATVSTGRVGSQVWGQGARGQSHITRCRQANSTQHLKIEPLHLA